MGGRMNAGGDTIVRHARGVQRQSPALQHAEGVHILAIVHQKRLKTAKKTRQFHAMR
ncbi:hypothetical protein [Burkholderia sp. Bp8998]|uniref:hypothetical protein n=1 Tax=Burkholderia sp. Bp8998 TaxID=2184557 RepID=UPI001639897E|nr:hypothetical protein [Burkholderia sp. Bp8998]